MKFYKKLIIFFILMLLISGILGSLLKTPVDMLVQKNDGFADLADYEDGVYNYGKIMRRIFMLTAVVLLILFRKSLDLKNLTTSGLKRVKGWRKEIYLGLIIGTGSVLIYGIYTLFLGIQCAESDHRSIGEFLTKLFTYLFAALLTAFIEETLFRGLVFQGLMKDFPVFVSVALSSFFYAILHLFSFKVNVSVGQQPFAGFTTLINFFSTAVIDYQSVIPYIIGLFIVGTVLALAFRQTKSLYLPIGLHAGWVFGIKFNNFLLDRNRETSNWFFGDGHMVSGICGWIFLLGVLFIVNRVAVRRN